MKNLLPISKSRISHSCWPLQAWKTRKEVSECFSLIIVSSKVFYVLLFSQWCLGLGLIFNLVRLRLSDFSPKRVIDCLGEFDEKKPNFSGVNSFGRVLDEFLWSELLGWVWAIFECSNFPFSSCLFFFSHSILP